MSSIVINVGNGMSSGNPLPKRPSRAKANLSEIRRFDGKVETRDDGEGYVRFIFGKNFGPGFHFLESFGF
jgi:hypothetical protein